MRTMMWTRFACLVLFAVASASAEGLAGVKNVYLMSMSRGMDQFLAERLTTQGVVQVVTDLKQANAVLTDRIGGNFDEALQELSSSGEEKAEKQGDGTYKRPTMQPLARGKGNIFLIDINTKQVLWSTYVVPKGSDSDSMNHAAGDVASRLGKSLKTARK